MKFIEETVVDTFLPTFRSLLAERLRELGLTQSEVAEHLGISQSAVSKYAHGDVERHDAVAEDERVLSVIDRIASGLADGSMTRIEALIETETLIRDLEAGDRLWQLHVEAVPELADRPDAFRLADPEGTIRDRERVLAALRGALDRLERTAGFAAYIPQVGSNLVFALPEAETIDDIAGVPGRILDVKGRATIPAEPEFGVSEHVASVVLAVRRGGSDHRAALNLAYDPELLHRLEAAGYRSIELDPSEDLPPMIKPAIRRTPTASVLFHREGPGIEANTYLLGPDPDAVVDVVRDHITVQ